MQWNPELPFMTRTRDQGTEISSNAIEMPFTALAARCHASAP
jgi:hypothetical protein